MRTYQNFIGGEWLPARAGKTQRTFNPADTREVVAEYPASGAEDGLAAVAAAEKAAPGWVSIRNPPNADKTRPNSSGWCDQEIKPSIPNTSCESESA